MKRFGLFGRLESLSSLEGIHLIIWKIEIKKIYVRLIDVNYRKDLKAPSKVSTRPFSHSFPRNR